MLTGAMDGVIARGRAMAEERMTSRATIWRKTGAMTTVNRMQVPVWEAVHTDLPFRIDGSSTSDGGHRSVKIGQVDYEIATGVGHMPADTVDLEDDDHVEVTSGEWADSVYRIIQAIHTDQKTARRVPIVEAPRPTEWAA